MFITGNQVQDHIITQLSSTPLTAKELSQSIEVSIQSIHKSLQRLLESNVVIKHKTSYTLNQEWVSALSNKLRQGQTILLEPGESVGYTFNSFDHLDRYWKHTLFPLINQANKIYIYDPHWIWWYLPNNIESEAEFVRNFNADHKGFLLIGGGTAEDREIRRQWQHDFFRISAQDTPKLPRHHYYTVIDNLVITTSISKTAASMIDEVYETNLVNLQLAKKLQPVLETVTHKISLKVENNQAKANKIKSIISKDFII